MAASYPITVKQGETFKLNFRIKINSSYIDLTSYSGRMQVRSDYASSTKSLDMTTANGRITMSSDGTVNFNVAASVMAAIPEGKYVYDFEIESSGGEVTSILEGVFKVRPEVTR